MMKTNSPPTERLAPRLILILVGVLSGVILHSLLYKREASSAGQVSVAQDFSTVEERHSPEFVEGKSNAAVYCITCHLQPPPDVLDKVNWGMEVLPDMRDWIGFRRTEFDHLDFDPRVLEANVLRKTPPPGFSLEQWRNICLYYIESAPTKIATPTNRPPIRVGLKNFEVFIPEKTMPAYTTMVKIDPVSKFIYIGTATNNTLTVLDAQAREVSTLKMPSPPVDLEIRKSHIWVTLVGSYTPSDKLLGKLATIGHPGDTAVEPSIVLNDLPRPVNTKYADLNGDGLEDIVMCGYGNILGELCWYEQKRDGSYEKQTLENRPGAITAVVHDFNKDGRPDIAVMFAQAMEGIYIFMNKGGGKFEKQTVTEKHAAWGFAHLELLDANGDGAMDMLASNGDNGDHVGHLPPFKLFHGVRLYLNDGKNQFTETWFYQLNGAYKTIARDFDQDGDLDVAVISFYADYRNFRNEGFIYLENKGGWNFDSYSFVESLQGRWLTMDAGDLDGDGDQDIVLGAFVDGPTYVPGALHDRWREVTPPVFILKNKTRR